MNIFYILQGNNGATYIFNAKNKQSIRNSLSFYKAVSVKQRVLKLALALFMRLQMFCNKIGALCVLKNRDTVVKYLNELSNLNIDFNLDENCSILISSTRDKIIINHQGQYFHKIAFGSSYKNVKNEAQIYKCITNTLENFEVSEFYESKDVLNEYYSFKLNSQRSSREKTIDLTLALVELFNLTAQKRSLFPDYCKKLMLRYSKLRKDNNTDFVHNLLEKLILDSEGKEISLGLVHRDFKRWNIDTTGTLLIYDFEEAVIDGPPFEDLFNFIVDPIIRYLTPVEVKEELFTEKNKLEYVRYMGGMEISISIDALLKCYLIERIIFYLDNNAEDLSSKYFYLLKEVSN